MKVELKRVNKATHYEATAPSTVVKVNVDGSPAIGGKELGVRPMELVLMALGSCSVLDLISILDKQRQTIEDVDIEVTGNRTEAIPSVFTDIHINFILSGKDIILAKAEKAAHLAVKKYCSVHDMLAKGGVDISYEVTIK
ncbi:MAG TPA: OsmC family protein [Sphingobacteriaceae bacterium]|nr:OsmC family protein [Sphingobacteriaceae bacterium]